MRDPSASLTPQSALHHVSTRSLLGMSLCVLALSSAPAEHSSAAPDPDGTPQTEAHIYHQKEGNAPPTRFHWVRVDTGKRVRVTSDAPSEHFTNVLMPDGRTLEWHVRRKDTAILAKRVGEVIRVTGRWKGKPIDRKHKIDRSPWYQPLSYSLRKQLDEDWTSSTFWMMRPDILEPVELKARADGEEIIAVGGRDIRCRRIMVQGTGMTGRLWHCLYWFRKRDGLFVRYSGLFGVPGLPKTYIELLEEAVAE